MNKKEFLIVAILTLLTVCAWVIFDIMHTRSEVKISPELQQIIEPLNPNFDIEGL